MTTTRILFCRVAVATALSLLLFPPCSSGAERSPAVASVALTCEIVGVVDGDTIDVALPVNLQLPTESGETVDVKTLIVRVRLLCDADSGVGCWAPETHRQSSITNAKAREAEYERGIAAKKFAEQFIGREAKLIVPGRSNRLVDHFTLERLLAEVRVDGKSIGELAVKTKHASTTKGGTLGK